MSTFETPSTSRPLAAAPSEVATTFARSLGLTPRHARAAERQAQRDEAAGDLHEALRHWALATTIDPASVVSWKGLARCLGALRVGRPRSRRISLVERTDS